MIFEGKVFRRDFNSIIWFISIPIDSQTLCLCIVSSFHFNWNKALVTLNDEINLCSSIRFPIVGSVSIDGELDVNIVFCPASFEIIPFLSHVQNIICRQVFFCTKQTEIRNIDLERINVTIVLNRFFYLFCFIDLRYDAR